MMYHGESFFGTVKSTCLQREPHQSKIRMCLPIQPQKLGFDSLTATSHCNSEHFRVENAIPKPGFRWDRIFEVFMKKKRPKLLFFSFALKWLHLAFHCATPSLEQFSIARESENSRSQHHEKMGSQILKLFSENIENLNLKFFVMIFLGLGVLVFFF